MLFNYETSRKHVYAALLQGVRPPGAHCIEGMWGSHSVSGGREENACLESKLDLEVVQPASKSLID
jgi:hypothetical protein